MTGESYRKIDNGPAPQHFQNATSELISEGKIREDKKNYAGYLQYKYESLKEPELDLLTSNELKVINNVINNCSYIIPT